MRVLVVEDEETLREQLVARLRSEGYAVDAAADGEEGAWCGEELPVDAAIVDLGLPALSGIDMIRRWREAGERFPVLILTARGQWQDKVSGLESGGDDYLVKPFHMEELLARLRALIRRSRGWADPVLRSGPLALDTRSQSVSIGGEPVSVTAFEYRILEYLMLHADRVISKSELSEHVYEEDLERDSNVVEVLVGRLRRKLDPHGNLAPIETLRGRGYRFRLALESGEGE
ncbi:MAG: response regulator [Gammaproteobacteria bacterium]|nr:response regulator [Gammaproteobacteria bacterium]NIM72081.1 response regulator [Gammaproteobacteria bacterium]NIN38362.1 response regulator [Gammaproteobacteria bacterium]NIO23808.1 response regulator [Gammaproteobacteria bacterium]NIO64450.1 response regulator [Gammaproteobacteria bacterium]